MLSETAARVLARAKDRRSIDLIATTKTTRTVETYFSERRDLTDVDTASLPFGEGVNITNEGDGMRVTLGTKPRARSFRTVSEICDHERVSDMHMNRNSLIMFAQMLCETAARVWARGPLQL